MICTVVSLRRRPESICSWVCGKSVIPRDGLENSALSTHTNTYTPWLIQCPYNLNASASVVVMRLLFLILYWILFVYRQTDRPTNLNPMTKDSWHGCRCLIASYNESRSSLVVISVAMNGWFVVWLPFDWTHYDILWIEIWLRILRITLVSISLLSLSLFPSPGFFVIILIVAYTHTHSERKSSSQIQM